MLHVASFFADAAMLLLPLSATPRTYVVACIRYYYALTPRRSLRDALMRDAAATLALLMPATLLLLPARDVYFTRVARVITCRHAPLACRWRH